jgi:hypothetical protein
MNLVSTNKAETGKLLLGDCTLEGLDILVLSPTPTYPLDKGNRKRIYAVCEQLRSRGARIHYLYYPQDWVSHLPNKAIGEMSKQWDSFHLVPSTRPLQTKSKEEDHSIDEWWDDSIGHYLKWLFSHYYFDAFIVNYTYLSNALEFAPKHVYRILDTHDKFTDRRILLESQGIAAEFFHTTREEEAIALRRADLVWAIKEEEALFFRKISDTAVSTLPHIEPYKAIKRIATDEDRDYLVIGMIGVNNSINVHNARSFVEQALPKFRNYLAPIKIRFAGTICDALTEYKERSGIELMGRIENVEDFYTSIDVAIVPMNFSTGLKIKAVEALTTGLPIVSHAHAFEGIPTTHPYHTCETFEQMADCCLELTYNRSKLQDLADATESTYHKMRQEVEGAMSDITWKIAKGKPYIIVIIPKEFFIEESLEYYHTLQTVDYFKHNYPLIYYIDTPIDAKSASLLKWRDIQSRIVLSPEALENSGVKDDLSLGICFISSTLEQLCQNRRIAAIWMLSMPRELEQGIPRTVRNTPTYVRTDVMNFYGQEQTVIRPILESLKQFNKITLVNCHLKFLFQNQPVIPHAETAIVPYWRELLSQIRNKTPEKKAVILAQLNRMEVAYSIWNMCRELFETELESLVIIPEKPANKIELTGENQDDLWQKDKRFLDAVLSATEFLGDFKLFSQLPRVVIDISGEHLVFAPYRETIKRAAIPFIVPGGNVNSTLHTATVSSGILAPLSVFHMIELIAHFATDDEYLLDFTIHSLKSVNFEYSKDAGWTKIWQQLKRDLMMSDIMVGLTL